MKFSSFRWYQFLRPLFVACGARRGGALLGKHGAGIEAFTVSGVLHVLGTWGGWEWGRVSHHRRVFRPHGHVPVWGSGG